MPTTSADGQRHVRVARGLWGELSHAGRPSGTPSLLFLRQLAAQRLPPSADDRFSQFARQDRLCGPPRVACDTVWRAWENFIDTTIRVRPLSGPNTAPTPQVVSPRLTTRQAANRTDSSEEWFSGESDDSVSCRCCSPVGLSSPRSPTRKPTRAYRPRRRNATLSSIRPRLPARPMSTVSYRTCVSRILTFSGTAEYSVPGILPCSRDPLAALFSHQI